MVLISLVSVLNILYFYISTFRSMCAVPNMAVFCSSLTSCFPGMLLTYFLNDFEIVPVAPIITGITFVFTLHMRCIIIIIIIISGVNWMCSMKGFHFVWSTEQKSPERKFVSLKRELLRLNAYSEFVMKINVENMCQP